MAMRNRAPIIARSKAIMAEGLAATIAFCEEHADKFVFFPPRAGPIAFLAIIGEGLTATDAQDYSERLVKETGVMVVAGAMFGQNGPDGAYLRLGFAKAGFAEKLAAWGATFGTVKLPGR
jgi:aspartate/methionine/tyrosine aminotransferase